QGRRRGGGSYAERARPLRRAGRPPSARAVGSARGRDLGRRPARAREAGHGAMTVVAALPAGGACCPAGGLTDAAVRPAPRAPISPSELADPTAYVQPEADGAARLNLLIENLDCGACIPEIEGALRPLPGVLSARVNLSTRRLALAFEPARTDGATLMRALGRLGYRAVPFDPELLQASADA